VKATFVAIKLVHITWNSLPHELATAATLHSFNRRLKAHFSVFKHCFNSTVFTRKSSYCRRSSVRLSVRHTGGSVKNGAS